MTCPDCNGKGEILLLTSTVPCQCQQAEGEFNITIKQGDEIRHVGPMKNKIVNEEHYRQYFDAQMLNAPIAPDRTVLQNVPEDRVHRMGYDGINRKVAQFEIKDAQRSAELDQLFKRYQERFAQSVREHLEKFNEKS